MMKWLKSFFLSKSNEKDASAPLPCECESASIQNEKVDASGDCYIADAPVIDPALDRFRRWPFAQRVARTIAARRDPSSIVIGIYGAWGDGKTTVLNFIEKELQASPNVICVRFNPWRFGDETYLLRNFFQTLSVAIGRSISSQKEKVGEWLSNYAAILAPVSLTLGGVVQVSPAESAKQIGRTLSSVELDELRNRIETFLKDEKKRVVVLMDDIDRLDKSETQAIFKLVKLSADFAYTAYVLAFDEEIVAAALQEKYGSGDVEAGQSFLEKIIQVPLHLPKTDTVSLRKLCFERVDEAVKESQSEFTEEQVQTFVRYFVDGLEIRLKTPRMAIRYGNALAFSLPILHGEVNPVDLMLIEGIRVFYPKLYDVVRRNPEVFLGSQFETYSGRNQQAKERALDIVNKGFDGLDTDEKDAAKNLLKVLFPRLGGLLGNMNYGAEWETTWADEQRVSSRKYFDRFFTYTIPASDISDQEFEFFVKQLETESIIDIATRIQKLADDRNAETFISKLRKREKKLPSKASKNLALAISQIGHCFPKPETFNSFATVFSQAGVLVSRLIENIPTGEGRFDTAEIIAHQGNPLPFAIECTRRLFSSKATEELERTFSVEEETKLGKILAERVAELTREEEPIYILFSKDAPLLLYIWSQYGSKQDSIQYLSKTMEKEPRNALALLKCYLPTWWGMDSGLSHKGDFAREQYDSLAGIIEADYVYQTLYKIYGSCLDSAKYHRDNDLALDEKLAHQFAFLYHAVKSGNLGTATPKGESETDNAENENCVE